MLSLVGIVWYTADVLWEARGGGCCHSLGSQRQQEPSRGEKTLQAGERTGEKLEEGTWQGSLKAPFSAPVSQISSLVTSQLRSWTSISLLLYFVCVCVCVLVTQLCLILCDPLRTIAHQAPLSMELSRQEYWSGLPCPSPGDLSDPGIEPGSPALQADSLLSEPPRKLNLFILIKCYNDKILQRSHKSLPVLPDWGCCKRLSPHPECLGCLLSIAPIFIFPLLSSATDIH